MAELTLNLHDRSLHCIGLGRDESRELTDDDDLSFVPIRRFGQLKTPQPPSTYRLATVFMAASPRGVQTRRFGQLRELRFEEEEAYAPFAVTSTKASISTGLDGKANPA